MDPDQKTENQSNSDPAFEEQNGKHPVKVETGKTTVFPFFSDTKYIYIYIYLYNTYIF